MDIIDQFIDFRYGYLKDICNKLYIDYIESTDANYNAIAYVGFYILKRPNNKIICISPQTTFNDISQFHLSQLAYMKIQYKSFDMEFNFNPTSNILITPEYINNLKQKIKTIIQDILNNVQINDINHYEDKMPNIEHYNLVSNNYESYFIQNIKYYIDMNELAIGTLEKIKPINCVFNFVYYNFDYMVNYPRLVHGVIKKLIEIKKEVNNFIHEQLNKEIIPYNDINVGLKTVEIITKLTDRFINKLNDIYQNVVEDIKNNNN